MQQQPRSRQQGPGAAASARPDAAACSNLLTLSQMLPGPSPPQAIGAAGAKALTQAVAARGRARAGGKVRVLTHCNTGSLATAAYGTALGVIRALHEAGLLEHAYCTETRPYNQGGWGWQL